MLQRVVVLRPFTFLNPGDLAADGDHGVDETVDLGQGFALGGLYHQRVDHRKGEGGRMETVVHQALGHVLGHHAAGVFQRAQVQDAFVGHMAIGRGVQRGVVVF